MGMEMPAFITEPLSWTGMEWPKGDETAMGELSDAWKQYHDALQNISRELESVRHGFDTIGSGQAFDAIYQTLGSVASEDMSELIDGADHLSDCCDTMAVELYILKMVFLVELSVLLTYVYFLLATAEINWSAPLEIAQAILGGQMTLREAVDLAVRKILAKILEKSIEEIAETGIKDLAKEAAQKVGGDIAAKYATQELRDAAKKEVLTDMAVEATKKAVFTTRDQVRDRVLWDKPIDAGDIAKKTAIAGLTGGVMSQPSRFVAKATGVERTEEWLVDDMHPVETPSIGRSAIKGSVWAASDFVVNRETGIVSKQVDRLIVTPFVEGDWRADSQPSTGSEGSAPTDHGDGATQPSRDAGAGPSNGEDGGSAGVAATTMTSVPPRSTPDVPDHIPAAP